ncbi:MAG TPA: heterodisulfide reductase-related iron-sulfur binding cluster [Acidothermaceae bacterium]|jgi:glycolate oxidase iron-sulfur subunit
MTLPEDERAPLDSIGAFDNVHPPSLELLGDCVHCGFCLASCPTYSLWGEEMDSPRGRIDLMLQGVSGEPLTTSMVTHFDQCLGCMACLPACPSGVQYDKLIEATRSQVERNYKRPLRERALRSLIFAVFPYPRRVRAAILPLRALQRFRLDQTIRKSRLFRRLPVSVRAMAAIAPQITPTEKVAELVPAIGHRRAVVGMLTGCVQSVFFSGVNAATARVLAAEGCDVIVPRAQECCGALSMHNGREAEAMSFARALIDVFDEAKVETIVVNSAGCGSTMKEYAHLLRDDPHYAVRAREFSARTRDVSEYIAELGPAATRHPFVATIAYHDACHLSNAQGVRAQPRRLLTSIPGIELREIPSGETCCGSAGIYNLLQPVAAAELGDRKARNVETTGAQLLVTANPGCLMQVSAALERAGKSMPTAHTIEVLDASIRGLPSGALLGRGAKR